VAYLLLIVAAVLAAVVAVIAAGVSRPDPLEPGRNGAIAYSVEDFTQRTQAWRSHLMDGEGADDRPIFYGRCPTFSADGTVLAYTSGLRSMPEVTVAAADGSMPRAIPGIGDSEYALSPDGTRIAWFKELPRYETPSQAELWMSPVSGGPDIRIVPAPADPNEIFSDLAWSPDGRQIAFASSELLVEGDVSGAYRSAISIVSQDGSNLRTLTTRPGTGPIGISWSPDGRYISYNGLPDGSPPPSLDSYNGSHDIFVINADGTEDRNLTTTTDDEFLPEWAPDGAHLAYHTTQVGDHLTIIRLDGPAAAGAPIQGPAVDGFVWSPDGTELLLVTKVANDSSVDSEKIRSAILSVDAEFRGPPSTLLAVDHDIPCPPTWQRLEP
jgi:WD40 repeat protein